jgi:acyl CoA:acetate/3-ketoacid CoA transferase beta subunit
VSTVTSDRLGEEEQTVSKVLDHPALVIRSIPDSAIIEGEPRIMQNCTLPLTGLAVVHRIVTDLAVLDIDEDGLRLVELLGDRDINEVKNATEVLR